MTNRVADGGFETVGMGDWTQTPGLGTITQTNVGAEVYCGTYAAKLARGATGSTELYQGITTIPGRQYTVSAYTRGDGASGCAKLDFWDGSNSALIGTYVVGNYSTSFAFCVTSFIAPPGCYEVAVILGVNTYSVTCYYDEVWVVKEGYFVGCWENGIVCSQPSLVPHTWFMPQMEARIA
jgi:hypothetical protein